MTKTRWMTLGVGIALILAAFGVVAWQTISAPSTATAALAQAAPTATPAAQATVQPNTNPAPSTQQNNIGDQFWQALAAKLGINVDTLKADAVQVRKDMLDQAVKNGLLTQAQADQIKQNLDANKIIAPIYVGRGRGQRTPGQTTPGQTIPGKPGRGFGFGFGGEATAVFEAVAKALNLAPSALSTQLQGGKTLVDIATAQNVDQAVVKQAIIDARKAEIDRQVADGLLTQAQADRFKANLTPDKIDLTRNGLHFGFH